MIVYNVGDKVKIKEDSTSLGVDVKKGTEGIIVSLHEGRVEAAFEGLGILSVDHEYLKKKVTKTERKVKAKNLKLTDEVYLPGSGEYVEIGSIYRNTYDSPNTTISIETVVWDSKEYTYNELVTVRR